MPKRVVIVATNYPELELFCPNWQGMKKGLERLGIPYKFVTCRPTLDVKEVTDHKADLIVYALLDMIKHPEWRKQIRDENPQAKIVFWYGDYRDERTGQITADCSKDIDAMFVSNNAQEAFYKNQFKMKEVHFLPLGSEPLEKPIMNSKYNFDFVFIGGLLTSGAFYNRAKEMQHLIDSAGLKVVNSFDAPMRAKIFSQMPTIYSSSKVCLDVSHFTDVNGYTSIRYFEIPAFWGFSLTKRFPGCEDLYPNGIGKIYFNTFEEAVDLKNYFVAHEKERRRVVELGHAHAVNHTYDKRFKKMFDILGF